MIWDIHTLMNSKMEQLGINKTVIAFCMVDQATTIQGVESTEQYEHLQMLPKV